MRSACVVALLRHILKSPRGRTTQRLVPPVRATHVARPISVVLWPLPSKETARFGEAIRLLNSNVPATAKLPRLNTPLEKVYTFGTYPTQLAPETECAVDASGVATLPKIDNYQARRRPFTGILAEVAAATLLKIGSLEGGTIDEQVKIVDAVFFGAWFYGQYDPAQNNTNPGQVPLTRLINDWIVHPEVLRLVGDVGVKTIESLQEESRKGNPTAQVMMNGALRLITYTNDLVIWLPISRRSVDMTTYVQWAKACEPNPRIQCPNTPKPKMDRWLGNIGDCSWDDMSEHCRHAVGPEGWMVRRFDQIASNSQADPKSYDALLEEAFTWTELAKLQLIRWANAAHHRMTAQWADTLTVEVNSIGQSPRWREQFLRELRVIKNNAVELQYDVMP